MHTISLAICSHTTLKPIGNMQDSTSLLLAEKIAITPPQNVLHPFVGRSLYYLTNVSFEKLISAP